jgi:biopolymer transport protein ExbD
MVLTTATFIKQGLIPVELPEAASAKKEELQKEINVYVKANGDMFVEKEQVDAKELEAKLSKISKEQTVVLRSDKEATFQDFVTVMDILKRLEHQQLYIVTKE